MRKEGFTLIEMLVVISIIGILAAILLPMIMSAKEQAKVHKTKQLIEQLKTALSNYQSDFGDYPPSDVGKLKTSDNNINSGIESLVACLSTQYKNGPYMEWEEDRLSNLDADTSGKNLTNWIFGDKQLREITDEWGNPLIYFHSRDYHNPGKTTTYTINGEKIKCEPQKSKETKAFHAPTTFMIWSAGSNMVNENGEEDDLHSW